MCFCGYFWFEVVGVVWFMFDFGLFYLICVDCLLFRLRLDNSGLY